MTLHFFFVPASRPEAAQAELNALLAQGRVVGIAREFVADGANSGWAFCVERTTAAAPLPPGLRATASARRGEAVDYKQVLSPEDFELFAVLRELRKRLAQAEGVPVYAVFSNEQLAQIATQRPESRAALAQVEGVGAARVERFGAVVLECLARQRHADEPPPATP
jgi:superfamily II DNA helicase RecQ